MNDDLWNSIFGDFGDIERRFERMFSELSKGNGKTYGYTMYQGPDGVPHVREFGNSGSKLHTAIAPVDPVLDVSRQGDEVKAVLELPGVPKEDIQLDGTDGTLTVTVHTPGKEIVKEIALPCKVDPSTAHAECNNGLLEVSLKAAGSAEKVNIKIE